jgi:hypothetical protein
MCILQGVTILQVEAIPIWFFLKSSLVKPTAWSIARLAALSAPSTTSEDQRRFKEAESAVFFDFEADGVLIREEGIKPLRYPKIPLLASSPSKGLDAWGITVHYSL